MKPRTPLVGPLFAWELVRLARRGQDARARTLLAASLLATLFAVVLVWFPDASAAELFSRGNRTLAAAESARFAEQFSLALLLSQMAVMVLLAPAYAAGAVAEEKERKSFPLLQASVLSNRELVLGKFFGRTVFLLGVMLAGLPVFALTGLVGGIDPLFLGLSYLLTGTTVTLLAAAGVAAAVFAPTFRGAMFRAYGLAAIYVLFGCGVYPLLSPFAVLVLFFYARADLSATHLLLLGGYVLAQLVLAGIALWLAVRRARPVRLRRPRTPPPKSPDYPRVKRRTDDSPEVANRPRVSEDDPFGWKERYTLGSRPTADEESIRGVAFAAGVVVVVVILFVSGVSLLVALLNPTKGGNDAVARTLLLTGSAAAFAHLLTVGSAAGQAVLRERQRETLDSLLTLPVERRTILGPKWRVSFRRGWWWGVPALAAVALGLGVSRVAPAAFPALVYLPLTAAFATSFGLWLSVRVTTTAKAAMGVLLSSGGLLLVPVGVWWSFPEESAWWATVVLAVAAGVVGFGALGFWRAACREFERYGRE